MHMYITEQYKLCLSQLPVCTLGGIIPRASGTVIKNAFTFAGVLAQRPSIWGSEVLPKNPSEVAGGPVIPWIHRGSAAESHLGHKICHQNWE